MRYTLRGGLRRAHSELRRLLLRAKPAQACTLTDLANIHRSDKGDLWFQRHGYTKIYEKYFAEMRGRPLKLLEIGLRHNPYYTFRSMISPSLRMWLDYFPTALVCGFDINEFSSMGSSRVRIFRGDQGNPADLRQVIMAVSGFDIIIDDGSHASHHQVTSLKTLLPALVPGGLYIIEDLHWQPPELERSLPKSEKTAALLKSERFLHELGLTGSEVAFYANEALAIIKKRGGESGIDAIKAGDCRYSL